MITLEQYLEILLAVTLTAVILLTVTGAVLVIYAVYRKIKDGRL